MMDKELKSKLDELRKMPSEEAADWLLANYPIGSENSGDAFLMIPRLSWKKGDQRKLAEHYLSKMPYANPRPYEAFATIMRTTRLVDIVADFLPASEADKSLLRYHLAPVLTKSVKSDADRAAVEVLLSKI
jgi:hypothetical protein